MSKKSRIQMMALAAGALLVLAGCSESKSGSSAAGTSTDTKKRVCAILPDASTSPIWENVHRPALTQGFTDAGFDVDVQNANGDTNKYATIGSQQLSGGCSLMVLVDLEGAALQIATNAKSQGIPVIALDRPFAGADYFVSYDNYKIGQIQGQLVVDAVKAEGKDLSKINVVYVSGDPTDGTVKLLHDGATDSLTKGGMSKPAGETQGTWDGAKAGTYFEQLYTKLGGKIDAVWAANDTNAAAVITILDKYGKKLPISGQDTTDAAVQNILLGKQSGTVNTAIDAEPLAAVAVGVDILNGKTPAFTEKQDGVPFIKVDPKMVKVDDIKDIVKSGQVKVENICTTDELKAACAKYGVQ